MTRAALIVSLAALAAAFQPATSVATPAARVEGYEGTITATAEGAATVIRIRGVITHEVSNAFARALDGTEGGKVVLDLDSPGGFTAAGYPMIDAVLAKRAAGTQVTTLVRGGAACESMCVGLFMAGERREAEPGARFMVHAPRSDRTGYVSIRASREMADRLKALGASPEWIALVHREGAFSGAVDHVESAEELARRGANVVTHLRLR
ncbi:ATP-dependent Clp protease proteolytic subunit [Arenibaculum pallidiluteum]|uniref:ATP-dependent Clp protease proteolytic subunit n=1 Tax=Arenibaculum pallidiluteum TaxID=2812559 RepID=UPI001A968A93|nr:ATP-dependent Clp protease proteolytic subunit [Arenibaculum pallidiluteum]